MIDPLLYFLLFLKASLLSSGGFSNLPSLRQDLLGLHWAKNADFSQSIAIGQISPGPNGLWVISLGYLTYGWAGALLALIALTIPTFFVLIVERAYTSIEKQRWVPGLMRGISLAVIALTLTVVWSLLSNTGADWKAWLIIVGAIALAASQRINLLIILGIAGLAGYVLYR
ncbi:chromate transporter [Tengunoibacter tsumagoiensis]|uniref:Chromate transporter n=1 Tax=Tengunoibacter tsumagoiensis TaxID=2014871 RepID=A0A401ZTY1_9CHLR|nr:chromate transporter [Tengunoibacter tsumagoiensis]GCE10307.1 chromate transporter [Tengunoibacter tsumagoiensis]